MIKLLDFLDLTNAKILKDNFNFIDEDGMELTLDKIIFEDLPGERSVPPRSAPPRYEDALEEGDLTGLFGTTGGANASGKKVRLNLLKNSSGVPVLFTALPHTDYLTKRWRGEPATYSASPAASSSSLTPNNLTECGDAFKSGLGKRHIKVWVPRAPGSSAGTVNAMSHLRRMASQPRYTQVDVASFPFMRALGITGGSMDGGAPLELKFDNCESGNSKKDNLSIRQSTQYLDLFKSVVQRLNHHNDVDRSVIDKLTNDLNAYRNAECKLFQDAFRLANALKSQNNGSLPDKQHITTLDDFNNSSDEVAKSESHLLGCLTKILTETCTKP